MPYTHAGPSKRIMLNNSKNSKSNHFYYLFLPSWSKKPSENMDSGYTERGDSVTLLG